MDKRNEKTFNKNLKNFIIFYQDKIDREEIKIGEFSNTNFISVLNALLYFPYLIKKLFITKEKKNKVYFKKIKDGLLKEVIIDDFFPVNI